MKIPKRPMIFLIVSAVACMAFFVWITLLVMGLFTETSYKITALFLSLILLSNILAKLCINTISKHGTQA